MNEHTKTEDEANGEDSASSNANVEGDQVLNNNLDLPQNDILLPAYP